MLETKFEVIGVAEDGRELVRVAEQLKPDVILLDISMPKLNGIEAAKRLAKSLPKAKVIFVTMHGDATFVAEALKAGASGYVVKRSAPQELETAIGEVLRGRTYVSPFVTKDFVDLLLPRHTSREQFGRLTVRQREVLQLVAEGQSIKEIASSLFITPKTVEFHKSTIMRVLGLRTTADLVRYAVKHGVVSVEDF